MKKSMILLMALCAVLVSQSCDKSTGIGDKPSKEIELTETELQARLDATGTEFINSIDVDQFEDIVNSLYEFDELMYDGDLETELDDYFSNLEPLSRAVVNVLKSKSYVALTKAKSDFEVYTFSFIDELGSNGLDITYKKGRWTVKESNEYAITVDYGDVLKLSYSKDMTDVRYDDEYYEESYIVSVPKKIDFEMTVNGRKALVLNVKPNVNKNLDSAEPSVVLTVDDVTMAAYAEAKGNKAGFNFTYTKGKKTILAAKGEFSGDGLADLDTWTDEDFSENDFERMDVSASVELQILDLKIAATGDLSKFIKEMNDHDDSYMDDSKDFYEGIADICNSNLEAYMVDVEKNAVIADVKMSVVREKYDGEIYYYVEPIIELKSGETISISSYFEDEDLEEMFEGTIRAFEDFIDSVEDMLN